MAAIYDKRRLFTEHWLLRCLNPSEAEKLMKYARVEHYPAKKEIFKQGDSGQYMMAVLDGRIKICSVSADGREIILNIIAPGEIFGEMALLSEGNRSANAITLERCDVLVVERRDFIPLLERNPELCIQLLDVICQKLRKTSEQVEETVFLDRSAKLAKTLLRLSDDYGKETPKGSQIDLKLSQRELGNLIGLTRESMNKQLGEWRMNGIISVDDGLITILDWEALEEISFSA